MFKHVKTIAFYTIVSRIFGYLRDLCIAYFFGASVYTDMFFIAFKIPNTFRRIIGEGALNSAVVPILSRFRREYKPLIMGNLLVYFAIALLGLTVFGVIFSKVMIVMFAPGYLNSVHVGLLNHMIKILFPYIFFIGLSILLMGFMNTYGRFAVPAFTPVLFNLSIIASVFLLFHRFVHPVLALCIGAVVGGFLQLLASFVGLKVYGISLKFTVRLMESTKEVFRLIFVTVLGGGIFQLSTMIDAFLASFMKAGSFSYLFYADRLFQLPFAIFSIAIAQAALPEMSRLGVKDMMDKTRVVTQLVFIFSVSAFLFFLFFGRETIAIVFGHGRFTSEDVRNTYAALVIFMCGFLFFSLVKVLGNVFYSMKDAKTPTKASVIASVVNIVCSVLLGLTLGFRGLAASVAISGFINAFVLFVYVNRRVGRLRFRWMVPKRAGTAGFVLAVFSILLSKICGNLWLRVGVAVLFYGAVTGFLLFRHYLQYGGESEYR